MIEQEYKTWLSKFKGDKYSAEKHFLASKGAIRLTPSITNFTIQNISLYNDLREQLRQMYKQQAYREYATMKRLEEEQYDLSRIETEPEIRLEDIPF